MDDARATLPRKRTNAFLKRNIYKTARRLRTYKILGDKIIEQQEEESRESTPASEDDESDNPENENSETSMPPENETSEEATNPLPQLESLKPKIPNPTDRKSTTFLVCDNINQFVLNSSFGIISTYSGKFGLFLRRGAPYRAQKVFFAFKNYKFINIFRLLDDKLKNPKTEWPNF